MKIFIELPTWLGDSVMASVAIQNIAKNFTDAKLIFFGSKISVEILKTYPNCDFIIDESKKQGKIKRFFYLFTLAKSLQKIDYAISFRSHFASKFLLFFIKAKKKALFKYQKNNIHQAQKYLNFVNEFLNLQNLNDKMKLYFTPFVYEKPTLGLSPGASYGSAKRWRDEYFAQVATKLSDKYDIVIFGSQNEVQICEQISKILDKNGVKHTNLCGKTDISKLASFIGGLSLFITNDSGPMHIAAAFKVPLIALFGPTNFIETAPFKHDKAKILHLNLPCMPCMKHTCPLKHHNCMEKLTPELVLKAINES